MGVRGLLAAALLLAGLGVGVWWSNKSTKANEAKGAPESPDRPKILGIPDNEVQKVEFVRKDGARIVLNRIEAAKWEMLEPQKLPGDTDAMIAVLNQFFDLKSDRVVDEKPADLSQFGLGAPSLRVTVTKKDAKSQTLEFGDDIPAGSGVFTKLAGDGRVFIVSSSVKSVLDKTWKDLRDKKLLTIDPEKVSRVELTAKKQTVELGRIGANDWQILKPRPMRADGWQIEEMVRKLREAKMDTNVSDEDAKKAVTTFASGTPVAVAKLTDPAGTQQLEVRKVKDDFWAKSSQVAGVFKVPKELGEGLDKGVDDFRNKKVFDFGFSDPTKVAVKDGASDRVIEKLGQDWKSGGKVMDPATVQGLIDKLRDLSAKKFTDTGTVAPGFELTVVSNDGKRSEKVMVAKSGGKSVAKRDGEPTVYELDANALDDLRKAISDVKEPPPPAKADSKKKADKKK